MSGQPEKSMYQATDKIAQFTNDINLLVTGGDPDQMVFLKKSILMEERMSRKNMTGKENSFHMENFRRRSRYAAVFLVLILAFAAITVLNINSGNVNISIPEIFRILLRRTGEGKSTILSGKSAFRVF